MPIIMSVLIGGVTIEFYYTSLEDRKPRLADLTVANHHVH